MNKYILILITLFTSCKIEQDKNFIDNDTVFITVKTLYDKIKLKDTAKLQIDNYDIKRVFNYIKLNSANSMNKSDTFSVEVFNNQDSFILIRKDTCYLFKQKDYLINHNAFRILKYIYDEKHTIDEEAEFLINDSIGIIRTYSLAWNNYVIYNHNNRIFTQIDSCINNDSSIFIRRIDNSRDYFNQFKE